MEGDSKINQLERKIAELERKQLKYRLDELEKRKYHNSVRSNNHIPLLLNPPNFQAQNQLYQNDYTFGLNNFNPYNYNQQFNHDFQQNNDSQFEHNNFNDFEFNHFEPTNDDNNNNFQNDDDSLDFESRFKIIMSQVDESSSQMQQMDKMNNQSSNDNNDFENYLSTLDFESRMKIRMSQVEEGTNRMQQYIDKMNNQLAQQTSQLSPISNVFNEHMMLEDEVKICQDSYQIENVEETNEMLNNTRDDFNSNFQPNPSFNFENLPQTNTLDFPENTPNIVEINNDEISEDDEDEPGDITLADMEKLRFLTSKINWEDYFEATNDCENENKGANKNNEILENFEIDLESKNDEHFEIEPLNSEIKNNKFDCDQPCDNVFQSEPEFVDVPCPLERIDINQPEQLFNKELMLSNNMDSHNHTLLTYGLNSEDMVKLTYGGVCHQLISKEIFGLITTSVLYFYFLFVPIISNNLKIFDYLIIDFKKRKK